MTNNESIITKTYDLLRHSIPLLNRFPRDFKFTLGERIQRMLADLLELLIEAYYQPPNQKRQTLQRVNILLEKLRHFFRLGYDLGLYTSLHYQDYAERLNEIGRMVGGWLKSIGGLHPPKNSGD